MNYIIVDLEATCWEGRSSKPNETIEIGAVLVDEHQNIISEFCQFIKPVKHPILSDFCKELTSITQEDVENANYFYEVIEAFKAWCQTGGQEYVLCSWGFYDKNQFVSDCRLHQIDASWTHRHISLKHQYASIKGLRRAIGMKRALDLDGFTLKGTHHRGIDDARNITKLFLKHFNDWKFH